MAYMGPSKGLLKKCLEAGVVLMLIVDGTVFVPMHSGLKSLTEQLCVTISAGPKAGFFFVTSDATGGLWTIEFGGMRTEKRRCVLPAQLRHVARA